MNRNELIDRIGYFRTRSKLSQKALSIELDVNVGYINRLECKRDFLPSLEVLFKIIEVCGCKEEEFFSDDYRNYSENKQITDKLKSLTKEKRDALCVLLQ